MGFDIGGGDRFWMKKFLIVYRNRFRILTRMNMQSAHEVSATTRYESSTSSLSLLLCSSTKDIGGGADDGRDSHIDVYKQMWRAVRCLWLRNRAEGEGEEVEQSQSIVALTSWADCLFMRVKMLDLLRYTIRIFFIPNLSPR